MIRQIPVWRDCSHCGRAEFTAAVSVLIVWASYFVPVGFQEQIGLTIDFKFLWVDL